jgi:phage-related protein
MAVVLSFGVEYGLTVQKEYKASVFTIASSSGTTPAEVYREGRQYEVKTVPISDASAVELNAQLAALNGGTFLSQFFMDDRPYYYRLEPSQWSWQVIGPNANTVSFVAKRYFPDVYEATIQGVATLRLKRAGFGDGYEQISQDGINPRGQAYDITTVPLIDDHAQALDSALSSLNGSYFWSRIGRDNQPYKYRLDPFQWTTAPEGPNRTVFTLKVKRSFDP